jgi:hypothetical protein
VAALADVGRQVLISRNEFCPPRLGVAALTPGQVGGEIFGVDLPPGPIGGDPVQGHALDLDDQDGLAAVGGQRGLDNLVERRRAAILKRLLDQGAMIMSTARKSRSIAALGTPSWAGLQRVRPP